MDIMMESPVGLLLFLVGGSRLNNVFQQTCGKHPEIAKI
jgi:hypothetical protein